MTNISTTTLIDIGYSEANEREGADEAGDGIDEVMVRQSGRLEALAAQRGRNWLVNTSSAGNFFGINA